MAEISGPNNIYFVSIFVDGLQTLSAPGDIEFHFPHYLFIYLLSCPYCHSAPVVIKSIFHPCCHSPLASISRLLPLHHRHISPDLRLRLILLPDPDGDSLGCALLTFPPSPGSFPFCLVRHSTFSNSIITFCNSLSLFVVYFLFSTG